MDILYEDNHIIAAVKPSGVLSQGDSTGDPDMLTLLKEYIKVKYSKPGNVYLGLVHRLDRPVSGVMVFARTSKAAARLSEQIRTHKVEKNYVAVIRGHFGNSGGKLVSYIAKDGQTNKVTVYDSETAGAKYAELDYSVLGEEDDMSLVDVSLKTGRSHQIRAQFAHIGHPLYGDVKYGSGRSEGDLALFCNKMTIDHPVKGDRMSFTAPLPDKYPFNIFKDMEE
ncbi:23S rRNA pseudouridine1911/1915/1917 synthase [Ruminococcaceae bacterium YRB3002]|nr:23S rRNA pseudouridine1911/1915/1917 synthase [Ruminococcaceae bacterium YRB3002]